MPLNIFVNKQTKNLKEMSSDILQDQKKNAINRTVNKDH